MPGTAAAGARAHPSGVNLKAVQLLLGSWRRFALRQVYDTVLTQPRCDCKRVILCLYARRADGGILCACRIVMRWRVMPGSHVHSVTGCHVLWSSRVAMMSTSAGK